MPKVFAFTLRASRRRGFLGALFALYQALDVVKK